MPRTTGRQQPLSVELDTAAVSDASRALTVQSKQTRALMEAYGVKSATPAGLEVEIRGYQQTAMHSLLAIGVRLMVLRTLTQHGEWLQSMERLQMAPRTAQKLMQAAIKFANPALARPKLQALGEGKLLELITLDDEELDALESGESVLELDLDDIASMSMSELRRSLREARQAEAAKDKLLEKRGKELDKLKKGRTFEPQPDSVAQTEAEQAQYIALQETHAEAVAIIARLAVVVRDIRDHAESQAMHQAATAGMENLCQRVADICAEHSIPIQFEDLVVPDWALPATAKSGKGTKR